MELLPIRGKKLYVEFRGNPTLPPLLYLHGGPGSSCYDFMYFQAERLEKHFYLIGVDQRGTLRSEPLEVCESLSPMDIVNDVEELRKDLNLNSWSILGHSFGGIVATLYAMHYPKSIEKIVYECPTFDFRLNLIATLKKAAEIFTEDGEVIEALQCERLAESDETPKRLMEEWREVSKRLGSRQNDMYIYGDEKNVFDRIFNEASDDLLSRIGQVRTHFEHLHKEGSMYESLLEEVIQLPHSILIISGVYDHVFCEVQQKFIQENAPHITITTFTECGHFPRIEKPDQYAEEVVSFLVDE